MKKKSNKLDILFSITIICLVLGLIIAVSTIFLLTNTSENTSEDAGSRVSTVFTEQGDIAEYINNPTNLAAATSTLGSMVGTTTLYFKLTSLDYAGGQTEPSSEVSCALGPYLTGAPDGCVVTMTPATGAETARLWIGTSTGVYYVYQTATSSTLVATTTGLTAGTIPTGSNAYIYNTGDLSLPEAYLKEYATADELIKSGAGFVHTITYSPTDAAATAGTIAILDSLTASGSGTTTMIYIPAAAMVVQTITLDQYFSTGIYVDFDTTTDVNVSISYK